jgi:hypothetical protein
MRVLKKYLGITEVQIGSPVADWKPFHTHNWFIPTGITTYRQFFLCHSLNFTAAIRSLCSATIRPAYYLGRENFTGELFHPQ